MTKPKALDKAATRPRLTVAQYNALFKAYLEQPLINPAARAAGVNNVTARYYITGPGAPEKGFEPIEARVARVRAAAQEQEELSLVRYRRDQMKAVVEILRTSDVELALHRKRIMEAAEAAKRGDQFALGSTFASAVATRDLAMRSGERLLGGSDVTVEHRGFDPLADMTKEEARDYATTGVLPERVRLFNAAVGAAKTKGP